nr:MAG TPA: hypothetical protein [Caudoviricetes sp.]
MRRCSFLSALMRTIIMSKTIHRVLQEMANCLF